ncbi:hypothetical protein FEM41_20005 [Jejubacter calystegiae]|uniref:Uncharacterized protein n=1 Tax=Jejubacter calystegiae TaxID=2579935 RepID=A0A4P8YPR1_9ENTR|nr:hypothetical protein FEM41_20005 [Jejubacter calystegiae]
MRLPLCVTGLILVLSGCASKQAALTDCPAPPPPPAWLMQEPPNYLQTLDRIITPSDAS